MTKSRFSEEQIIGSLKEGDGSVKTGAVPLKMPRPASCWAWSGRASGTSRGPDRNAELPKELLKLVRQTLRYGYRRLGVLLAWRGQVVNMKRVYRCTWRRVQV